MKKFLLEKNCTLRLFPLEIDFVPKSKFVFFFEIWNWSKEILGKWKDLPPYILHDKRAGWTRPYFCSNSSAKLCTSCVGVLEAVEKHRNESKNPWKNMQYWWRTTNTNMWWRTDILRKTPILGGPYPQPLVRLFNGPRPLLICSVRYWKNPQPHPKIFNGPRPLFDMWREDFGQPPTPTLSLRNMFVLPNGGYGAILTKGWTGHEWPCRRKKEKYQIYKMLCQGKKTGAKHAQTKLKMSKTDVKTKRNGKDTAAFIQSNIPHWATGATPPE